MKAAKGKAAKTKDGLGYCIPLDENNTANINVAIWVLRTALNVQDAAFLGSNCDDFLAAAGDYLFWPEEVIEELRSLLLISDQDREIFDPNQEDLPTIFAVILKNSNDRSSAGVNRALAILAKRQPDRIDAMLRQSLLRLEQWAAAHIDHVRTNVDYLASIIGLNDTDQAVLRFCSYARQSSRGIDTLKRVPAHNFQDGIRTLAILLDAPLGAVAKAIGTMSRLQEFGLLNVDTYPGDMEDLTALPNLVAESLIDPHTDINEFMRHFVQPVGQSLLATDDFPHLDPNRDVLKRYLGAVIASRVAGANILFYGEPGTGKTEFASILTRDAGFEPFEVGTQKDGASPSRADRLASLRIAQRFLSNRANSVIIFDEIEDVFPSGGMSFLRDLMGSDKQKGSEAISKAWMNRTLETNAVPVIWISNAIHQIDPAYLRRFRYHLEFRKPPAPVRRRIAEKYLGNDLVSEEFIGELARDAALTPAQIESATHFVKLSAPKDVAEAEQLTNHVIELAKRAGGHRLQAAPRSSPTTYRLDYLNLDARYPIDRIVTALKTNPTSTLCFYGLPGTGKTALAEHIADAIGRPLLAKRASDILDKYVGGTEENIAAMFREATNESAVLFLDEADSLLRNRENARQSWEVTQVNELLQQMEHFKGIFICATNLFDDLDAAALRRFAFKIRFNPMTLEQRTRMFAEEALGGDAGRLSADMSQRLRFLDTLVPGDFAVVIRQTRLLGELPPPDEFLRDLESECQARRRRTSKAIGFV